MLEKVLITLIIVISMACVYLLWPWITPLLSPHAHASLAEDSAPVTAGEPAGNAMATPTPLPQEIELMLPAVSNGVGWASGLDGRSYLAEPEILAGSFDGNTFVGAMQFDLSSVPAGAILTYAELQLTGHDGQNLQPGGKWELHLLDSAIDAGWPTLTYNTLRQAISETTVGQPLTSANLVAGQANSFHFDARQLVRLQEHLINGLASFRLDAAASDDNNIFTWNGNAAANASHGNQPQLYVRYVPGDDVGKTTIKRAVGTLPPALAAEASTTTAPTPTATRTPLLPEDMIVVTSTPLPENIVTLAAEAAEATHVAETVGTYTPVPQNWVTPIVVTPGPTPANKATAEFLIAEATAGAFLNGPATATPYNVWTATPTVPPPTNTPTASPTAETMVLVTPTPTPENVLTVAAQAARATAVATAIGTFTPEPRNWVFPVVVTPEPAPANEATATFRIAAATAEAFLSGSRPRPVWTATPTPFMQPVAGQVATPWAATPTATPPPIPQQLVGKIAFLSNRSGGPEPLRKPLVYVINPDGSNLSVLTDDTFYQLAEQRDKLSAEQRFRTFVKDFPRYFGNAGQHEMVPAIFYFDYEYSVEGQITFFGAGDAWDPAWSPTGEQIVFVSNDSQDDEIWVVNRDGSELKRLTETNEAFNGREIGKDSFVPEINGHPSWSPDGSQIVFWSTRGGHRQIWVMNADGSNAYSLNATGFDDWNPVWIKYTDPAH